MLIEVLVSLTCSLQIFLKLFLFNVGIQEPNIKSNIKYIHDSGNKQIAPWKIIHNYKNVSKTVSKSERKTDTLNPYSANASFSVHKIENEKDSIK